MKVVQILSAVLFIYVLSAINIAPDAQYLVKELSQTGSIEGTAELASRTSGTRSGGGLYGRPSRSTQQTTASNDSILVILSTLEANDQSNSALVYLNQKDRQFQPGVLPVTLGQTVRILNSDPVYHNVFSLTSPNKFDVGRRPKGEHFDVTFDKPGMVDVFCDIHSNMHAIIYVMPENTIAWKKIANGQSFQFDTISEGEYTLTLIALGYKEIQENVLVTKGETAQVGTIILNP